MAHVLNLFPDHAQKPTTFLKSSNFVQMEVAFVFSANNGRVVCGVVTIKISTAKKQDYERSKIEQCEYLFHLILLLG